MLIMQVSDEEFDGYVREAIAGIDPQFRDHLEEVPVIVEDLPGAAACRAVGLGRGEKLLGLFHGVPLNKRSVRGPSGPNQIVLYRKNIAGVCRSRSQLARQIRKTLVHELGHYLGFSEAQLRGYRY